MFTKQRFKELYEVDGKIQTTIIRDLFEDIEDVLESNNNIEWLEDRNEWLKDFSDCLLHYTNDVERSISDKKNNKKMYGLQDRDKWIVWVEKVNGFKSTLEDLRRHADEIYILTNKKLKDLKKALRVKENAKSEKRKNDPKRYVIHAVFHHDGAYKNVLLFSDVIKIISQDTALEYLDLYQTNQDGLWMLVNYRAFPTRQDFELRNAEMIDVTELNDQMLD